MRLIEAVFGACTVNVEEVLLLLEDIRLEIHLIDSFLKSILQLIVKLLLEVLLELKFLLLQLLNLTLRERINILIAQKIHLRVCQIWIRLCLNQV